MDDSVQNNQLQIPTDIRTFLEGILQDANLLTLDEDTREEMIKELFVRLDNFITAKIIDNMPEDKLETFIRMNEAKKPKAEVEAYIKAHMPNAQQVFTDAFMEFREQYLGNVSVARHAPSKT